MNHEKVLVIDDSREIIRHLTEQVLPTFGYSTLSANDGRTGLDMIRRHRPNLVLLDLNLPEMNGLDVLHTLAEESSDIPVILMTGYGSEKSAIQAFRLGAKDYLVKPFTVEELEETLNRALMESRLRHDNERLNQRLSRLNAAMHRQVRDMSTLFGIGKSITSILDSRLVADRLLDAAMYLANAEEAALWLPQDDPDLMRMAAHKTRIDEDERPTNLATASSLVGEVMRTGKALRQSAFSGQGIKVKTGFLARAILFTPLMMGSNAVGVLGVINNRAPRSFSHQNELMLNILAGYGAIALENARQYDQTDKALAARMEDLGALIRLTRTLTSTLDLTEIVHLTVEQVHAMWQVEACSVWLLTPDQQYLQVIEHIGTPGDVLSQLKVPIGQSIAGAVVESGESVCTNNAPDHPRHYPEVDRMTGFDTRKLVSVPLVVQQKVIGALQLLNKIDGDFDAEDVERAKSMGLAVATAITNAQLYREAQSGKHLLEVTLDSYNHPIIITDENNRVLLLNEQATTRLGLSEDSIGRPATSLPLPPELHSLLEQSLAEDRPQRTELELEGGTALVVVAPIPDYGRLLIFQDITYLKDLQKSKDSFLATVSHDLRAPLNSVIGFANAIGEMGQLNEQQEEFAQRIVSSSERMMDLVTALLELAKINSKMGIVREVVDMNEIVWNVIGDLQGQAMTRKIELSLDVRGNIGPVEGDPTQLRQAISNLVDNAIKYSPDGEQVHVYLAPDGERLNLHVKDSGQGIAEQALPHIFDEFYRVRDGNGARGAGLGLTLVKSIAEAHGGQVTVRSQPNVGSVFTVVLPMLPVPTAEVAT